MPGATLDTGALIEIERGGRRMQALIDEATVAEATLAVPAGALAQAWRGQPRQARLARFLRAPNVAVVPLDDPAARAAGVSCARSATDDVIDASVVLCARHWRHAVISGDPDDIRTLDPSIEVLKP